MPKPILYLVVLALTVLAVPAGATVLFDFESARELSAWTIRAPKQDSLEISKEFASSGSSSLKFHTPAWQSGMEEWPAFQCVPPIRDWRAYDRLIVDISNPTADAPKFFLYVSDSVGDFRKSRVYEFALPVKSSRRYVLDLKQLPQCVDRSDISILHFFTERPKDLTLYIDNISLLKPGDTQPPLPQPMFKQQVSVLQQRLAEARAALDTYRSLAGSADAALAANDGKLDRAESGLDNATPADGDRLFEIGKTIDEVKSATGRLVSIGTLRESCRSQGIPTEPMLVGFATSMEKILPKDVPVSLRAMKSISITAARNEKECFQIAVTPSGLRALRKVSVSVSDLRSSKGQLLPSGNIDCDVVGYVRTKIAPPYQVPYVGWWPDPILNFLRPVDIAAGDIQTFWIRVKVPKGQTPDTYKGAVTVSAEDAEPMRFGLSLKVRSFTLPDCSPIPTAITAIPPEFNHRVKDEICGTENWNAKLKYDYADFLADYYIGFDSLYDTTPPDYDILKHLHDEGRLVSFNFGNFGGDVQSNIERFRPIYQKCKELGIIDHAYIYGFDESPTDGFPALEKAAAAMKKEFPDVLLMTTAYDKSYGTNGAVNSIDTWCPLTPSYDPEKVSQARKVGRKVWWYICCGPHSPYANWFVEYDAIEARLLMGAMTTKYRPDGFLYYSLAYWNANSPITTGPFTTWDPISWTTYDGDGSLYCCGPGGKPVPTIRLENYRDGMEDTAYAKILETIVAKYEAKGDSLTAADRKWLEQARKALAVPTSLVKDMSDYTRDPKAVYGWRDKIADAIDTSGMPNVDPWGSDFGVRGFENK